MKNNGKFFGVIVIFLIIGFLFSACDTGTSNGQFANEKLNAIGPDCTTYTIDTRTENRSVRSVQQGGVYGFTIITPKQGSGFDTVPINVTVQNIEPLGNGKEKVTLKRSDDNTTFTITFDSNGEMIGIQGLNGCRDGILTPIDNNNNSLDGIWFGWNPHGSGNAVTIQGNEFRLIVSGSGENPTDLIQKSDFVLQTNPPAIVQKTALAFNPTTEGWDDISDQPGIMGIYEYEFSSSNPNKLTTKNVLPGLPEGYSDPQEWTRVPTN